MTKFTCACVVLFAFIVTSCDEQTTFDSNAPDSLYGDTYNDSEPDTYDDLNNSNDNERVGNKSGSRIIFNEYHLSDGSIISDNRPFDITYNRHCTFATDDLYEGLDGCCVSFDVEYIDPPYVESFYSDSNCTNEVTLLKLSSQPNNGDLVRINVPVNEDEEYICGEREYKDIYALIISPVAYNVYVYDYDTCLSWTEYVAEYEYEGCNYLADYKELTIYETRALFVCTE